MANIETHSFPVNNFNRIAFRAMGNVKIIQGEEEGLTVSGETGALDKLRIEVVNNELIVRYESFFNLFFWPRSANYEIKVKSLHGLEISGAGDVKCEELLTSDMKISINGSGKIEFGSLESDKISMNSSGSGRVSVAELTSNHIEIGASGSGHFILAGRVETMKLHNSGSATVEAFKLAAYEASIHISGAGKYEVNVQDKLDVRVSGSGNIAYLGDPRITQAINGSANIHKATPNE
ncbi:MAG: DUF2807 domain-containing protein [Anaerolineae bacterium]|nr:DUF2807 domain-containing protein [Anaerolineae bacterium]